MEAIIGFFWRLFISVMIILFYKKLSSIEWQLRMIKDEIKEIRRRLKMDKNNKNILLEREGTNGL